MDLTPLKVSDDAVEMEIFHPVTGEKMDITILVIGDDNAEYKQNARMVYKAALKKAPKGNLEKLNSDLDEEFVFSLKAAHIKGWKNIQQNEKPLKFSKENAVYLIQEYPWIRDQIDEFVSERANFIKG